MKENSSKKTRACLIIGDMSNSEEIFSRKGKFSQAS